MATARKAGGPAKVADQWGRQVGGLIDTIEGWCTDAGWLTKRDAKMIRESDLGEYEVDVLTVQSPQGRLVVEPIARFVTAAEGRVDIYAWPSLDRFMLVRQKGEWTLLTDSGVRWPRRWGRKTFLDLAAELVRAR